MLTGRSILHVKQGPGRSFVPKAIEGYFNDLTNKVLKDRKTLEDGVLPKMQNDNGEYVVFATTIFQYGLGCYDLFLQRKEPKYLEQFRKCLDWALANQDRNGGWDISTVAGCKSPYGAMAQGEGVSLLLRGYTFFKDKDYFEAAKRGVDLMLRPLEDGGTSYYEEDGLILMEFMDTPTVLNGWIFALFGLYDFSIVCPEPYYRKSFKRSLLTLKKSICSFDTGYWSKYNAGKSIASPFYHKLHIAQLISLSLIDRDERVWEDYRNRFERYLRNPFYRIKAFAIKVYQKVSE